MRRQHKWFIGCICIGMWLGTARSQAAIVTNYIENYDSAAVGTCPAGYNCGSTAGNGFAYVTNSVFESSPNSLLLDTTNAFGGNWVYALRNLTIPIPSNFGREVDVFYQINLAQTNGYTDLILTDGATATFLNFGFNGQGQIRANNLLVGTYNSNTWYDVHLHFVPAYHQYDAFVSTNGSPYASITAVPFTGSGINFDLVYFQNFGNVGGDSTMHVDNVAVISGIPEPSPMGISALGLLGLIGLKRVRRNATC